MSACIHPITLVRNGRTVTTRCGCCPNCIKEKQKSWALRAEVEGKYWFNHPNILYHQGYMFTFTYDQKHVPVVFQDDILLGYDLVYSHISGLLRDLRKRNKGGKKVRPRYTDRVWYSADSDKPHRGFSYMLCGELGAKFGRCHFHMLAYGITTDEARWLQKHWIERYAPDALEHNKYCMFGNGKELGCNIKQIGCTDKDVVKVGKYCSKYCSKSQQSKHTFDEMSQRPRLFASRSFGFKRCYRIKQWQIASNKSILPSGNLEKFKISAFDRKPFSVSYVYSDRRRYDLGKLDLLYRKLQYVSANIDGKNVYSRLPNYYLDRLLPKRTYVVNDPVTGDKLTRTVPEDNVSFSVVYSKRNAYTAYVLYKNDCRDRYTVDTYVQRGFVKGHCTTSGVYYSAESAAFGLVSRQYEQSLRLVSTSNGFADLQFFNSQCDGQ